jgi:hypothetical protein
MPQRGTNPLRDANLKPSVASSAEGFLVPTGRNTCVTQFCASVKQTLLQSRET